MGKFVHRVGGEDIPKFGGIRRECDPGAIPPSMFRDLVNARLIDAPGSPVKSRGGQIKHLPAMLGQIKGIFCPEFDFNTAQPCNCPGLVATGDIPPGQQAVLVGGPRYIFTLLQPAGTSQSVQCVGEARPTSLNYFRSDRRSPVRVEVFYPENDTTFVAQTFRDAAIISKDGVTAYTVGSVQPPYQDHDTHIASGSGDTTPPTKILVRSFVRGQFPKTIASYNLTPPGLSTGGEYAGEIGFYGTDIYVSTAPSETLIRTAGGASDAIAKIYKVSGTTLVLDDSPGGRGCPLLMELGADLYAVWGFIAGGQLSPRLGTLNGNNNAAGKEKIRRKTGGVWGNLAVPFTEFSAHDLASFSGAIYAFGQKYDLTGGNPDLNIGKTLKIVGAVVTVEHAAGWRLCPVAFDGFLYYLYQAVIWDAVNGYKQTMYVGRFNGAAWTDTYKNLSALFPRQAGEPFGPVWMGNIGGNLNVFAQSTPAAPVSGACVVAGYSTKGTDVAGTWKAYSDRAAFLNWPRAMDVGQGGGAMNVGVVI